MHSSHLPYWLAAIHFKNINTQKFLRWLSAFDNIDAFFKAHPDEWRKAGVPEKHIATLQNPDWDKVASALQWENASHHHLIAFTDECYPWLLKQIADPPLLLFVQGNKDALSQHQIAIVGSRHATRQGIQHAKEFARVLSQTGLAITSGLALGIDAASHQGAILAKGITVGVAGTGLNHIYPTTHRELAETILSSNGTILSEFPLDTLPHPKNFPQRNRIIAGLSLGVLVVEAAIKSGSLITARLALEAGREVFAIPGSIYQSLARGCHHLIRQGATLVEKAEDILVELGTLMAAEAPKTEPLPTLPPSHRPILEQIEHEITPLDVILWRSGLTAGEVSSILLSLELSGYIQSVPGGYQRILNID